MALTPAARKDGEVRDADQGLEELRDQARERGIGIWSNDKKGAVRQVKYRESVKCACARLPALARLTPLGARSRTTSSTSLSA